MTQDTLIIHIHGGGFIGTSTVTHEAYLRKWVNRLNVPLIGIDYSLSPKAKYPEAVNDCWQSYNWIVKNCVSELGFNPKHIIWSGDSAGGNLILSLLYLLIVHDVQLPELVLAEYPCCDTSLNNMSVSMLLSLQDFLLNFNFWKFVNGAYRSNYLNEDDPFLNPEKAQDCILKKVPKIRFFIGSKDPLRDGSVRLVYKWAKCDVDVKCYEFKNYMHGFYGLDSRAWQWVPTEVLMKEIEEYLNRNKSEK